MKYDFEVKPVFTKNPENLVFLDIETTGLDPAKGAKIIEIAMLKTVDGDEHRYESFVNPGFSMPEDCSKVHCIYDDMVKDAPFFKCIAKDVISFIGNGIVVCHNVSFDLLFVCKELSQADVLLKNIFYVDTLKLARRYFNFESNKLGRIANAMGIEVELSHRAMSDVVTMKKVAKRLFADMYRKDIDIIQPLVYEYKQIRVVKVCK
ncbi:MAG: 3'-5' exonuclease [Endomicrobium sp.]|jgi:DNA polymerase III epsilon subunit family exonuclease|nr:3'-5' exonuclease [Endomicrobium sp.]